VGDGMSNEPVAYVSGSYAGHFTVVPTNPALVLPSGMALYAHPPQREPPHQSKGAGMTREETIRRRWEKFEPMRIRIMQEAYDCADRNEVESYNSIKVMCSEVLRLAEEMVLAEREACADIAENWRCNGCPRTVLADQIRARGQE
jgi:hypothetical protein